VSCFALSFEILFTLSDEFIGFLDELARELGNGGGKVILTSSGIIYASENALLQIHFSSDEALYTPQIPITRGFLRAVGKITCSKALDCGSLYEVIYNIAKNRRLRIRVL